MLPSGALLASSAQAQTRPTVSRSFGV